MTILQRSLNEGSQSFQDYPIRPHGGVLIQKVPSGEERLELFRKAETLKKLPISSRYASHLEMIAIGGYSPLKGFMTREEALGVIRYMHLPGKVLWSIPILLPYKTEYKTDLSLKIGEEIALVSESGGILGIMLVEDIFDLNLDEYLFQVFKTKDEAHPGVKRVLMDGNVFIGGEVIALLNRPKRNGISEVYFQDPIEVRKRFISKGWRTIVAFQTRNPIHRAHEYLIKSALEWADGAFIHPLVGETKPDDVPPDVRMRCYEVLIENYFNKDRVHLSVLPAPMHYAGPREAVHHMIMRKNYGATHMIIGRDHAGVGNYYGTYEAQEFVEEFKDELEIQPVKFEHAFYCKKCEGMATSKTCPHGKEHHVYLSGTKVREMLKRGERPPKEFSRPEVVEVLLSWYTSNRS